MKNIIRISALVSLLMMISITGFCQGTVAMKFNPGAGTAPFQARYCIWDVTTQSIVPNSLSSFQPASPTSENDYYFINNPTLTSNHVYRFTAYVEDATVTHTGQASTATFTGAEYNMTMNFKKPTDIIVL